VLDTSATLNGECKPWPTKDELTAIFRNAGLAVTAGRYAVRVIDCEHFSFEHYGGDVGDPVISADAETPERMIADGQHVSAALIKAGVRHRFEVYDSNDNLIAYLHHDWPSGDRLQHSRE
jgi:hypothetical protein